MMALQGCGAFGAGGGIASRNRDKNLALSGVPSFTFNVFSWYRTCDTSGVMINSLSNLTQSVAPLSSNAPSKLNVPSTGQPADSAGSFVSQLLASLGQQQGSKPGSGQNNSSAESLMNMLDSSSASMQNTSLNSMAPASLYSTEF